MVVDKIIVHYNLDVIFCFSNLRFGINYFVIQGKLPEFSSAKEGFLPYKTNQKLHVYGCQIAILLAWLWLEHLGTFA